MFSDEPELAEFVMHTREQECAPAGDRFEHVVHQYRNGEILIGRPHKFYYEDFHCYYREISGALIPSTAKYDYKSEWILVKNLHIFKKQ